MRSEISELVALGMFPLENSPAATVENLQAYETRLLAIERPLTDEEACALVSLFHPSGDVCYGLAWTLVTLVETAPNWPLWDCLTANDNDWVMTLLQRAANAGFSPSDK